MIERKIDRGSSCWCWATRERRAVGGKSPLRGCAHQHLVWRQRWTRSQRLPPAKASVAPPPPSITAVYPCTPLNQFQLRTWYDDDMLTPPMIQVYFEVLFLPSSCDTRDWRDITPFQYTASLSLVKNGPSSSCPSCLLPSLSPPAVSYCRMCILKIYTTVFLLGAMKHGWV